MGFVPLDASWVNDLGLFRNAQSSRFTRNLRIRYKTGTAETGADSLSADNSAFDRDDRVDRLPRHHEYFGPGPASFMINYIVDDLDALSTA